jgi:hypothetical protein
MTDEVKEFMESGALGVKFELRTLLYSKDKYYHSENLAMNLESAELCYKAQQRAVLKAKIDLLDTILHLYAEGKMGVAFVSSTKVRLNKRLRELEEK